jgi:hypothetical protein
MSQWLNNPLLKIRSFIDSKNVCFGSANIEAKENLFSVVKVPLI